MTRRKAEPVRRKGKSARRKAEPMKQTRFARLLKATEDIELSLREFVRDVEAAYEEEDRDDGGKLDEDWYDLGRTYAVAKVRLQTLDELRGTHAG